jgi:predicted DNA-binding transcriptional regulator AlpA
MHSGTYAALKDNLSRPPQSEIDKGLSIPQRRLYSLKETCQLTHMSRATFWRRMDELDVRRLGRRVFVTSESIERFLAELPKAGRPA